MKNSIFGELTFNTGWKAATDVTLFGETINITVKLKAYYEKDGISAEQENASSDFINNKERRIAVVEKLLDDYADGNAAERFIAKTLLINRDGSYAILFDDKKNEDDGVAVSIVPAEKVLSQDEYL